MCESMLLANFGRTDIYLLCHYFSPGIGYYEHRKGILKGHFSYFSCPTSLVSPGHCLVLDPRPQKVVPGRPLPFPFVFEDSGSWVS